jgi:hypothetical protein
MPTMRSTLIAPNLFDAPFNLPVKPVDHRAENHDPTNR